MPVKRVLENLSVPNGEFRGMMKGWCLLERCDMYTYKKLVNSEEILQGLGSKRKETLIVLSDDEQRCILSLSSK